MKRLLFSFLLLAAPLPAQFVTIPGSERVPGFELAVHPVTNAEYAEYVKPARAVAPPHWPGGRVPAGRENLPVVFVNRSDVDGYLRWRSARDGVRYRLPTAAEFEHAARGGLVGKRYPWGDDPPENRANFDPSDSRPFDAWAGFLKPVKSYPPNGYDLYDMAGNVWQMLESRPDPATRQYLYRLENPLDIEGAVAGGSWARGPAYLRCGLTAGLSAGIRHPDLGFRLVREPAYRKVPRAVVALPQGQAGVFLSWRLLPDDPAGVAFDIYRSPNAVSLGRKINNQPVASTNYLDTAVTEGTTYVYRILARSGASEPARVTASAKSTGLARVFKMRYQRGPLMPVFGDLDGDGVPDVVIRIANGITEMSEDPGVPVELAAFLSDGRRLWRRPLVWHDHCFGNANNVPFNVFDLDGDGRAEVITRLQLGDDLFLAVLDGLSGQVLRKTPWPRQISDFSKTSTRVHLAIAYLDGKHPAIVTQTGLYENETISAFDADLKPLWEFRSVMETSGSGSHRLEIADVDGDGRDEVLDGSSCLNPDGTLRWSVYRAHPDIAVVGDFRPSNPGLEVYYVVETSVHAGAYLVDASTGRLLWKHNREMDPRWTHGHAGWASRIWEGAPGFQLWGLMSGHDLKGPAILFSSAGAVLADPFRYGYTPVQWTGDGVRQLLDDRRGRALGRFDGRTVTPIPGQQPVEIENGRVILVADLFGDFRDEIVVAGPEGDGIYVFTATKPLDRRAVSSMEDDHYRLWIARHGGGGYAQHFELWDQPRKR